LFLKCNILADELTQEVSFFIFLLILAENSPAQLSYPTEAPSRPSILGMRGNFVRRQEIKMPRFFTVKEVARIFRRHPRTIYRWLAEGFIEGKKVKDGWFISEKEIDRVFNEAEI